MGSDECVENWLGGQEKEAQKGDLLTQWRLESREQASSELDLLLRQVGGVVK